ncbi:MAG: hypothetical protein JEZ06_07920 [Anaerolineaceae bacterium]|nr:hypothetical protein [Anaerolineaceae bacterium]
MEKTKSIDIQIISDSKIFYLSLQTVLSSLPGINTIVVVSSLPFLEGENSFDFFIIDADSQKVSIEDIVSFSKRLKWDSRMMIVTNSIKKLESLKKLSSISPILKNMISSQYLKTNINLNFSMNYSKE